MSKVNLFHYATSELSQDAFICWLLAHALPEHQNENPALTNCALDFLHKIPKLENVDSIKSIRRQYKKIDVLVETEDYSVIIEDKTFTNLHNSQIDVYTNELLQENIPREKIITVFYKMIEQDHKENVDFSFDRATLLQLLRPYSSLDNAILTDYLAYLEEIEIRTNAYITKPITQWGFDGIRGFFSSLQRQPKYAVKGWGYVNNASGGFMGLWFDYFTDKKQFAQIGGADCVKTIYLQLENDINRNEYILAVKLEAESGAETQASEVRRKLYCQLKEAIPDFERRAFRQGKSMTVGYVSYDKKNYDKRIRSIHTALARCLADKNEHEVESMEER